MSVGGRQVRELGQKSTASDARGRMKLATANGGLRQKDSGQRRLPKENEGGRSKKENRK